MLISLINSKANSLNSTNVQNVPDNQKTTQKIWRLSRQYGNFPDHNFFSIPYKFFKTTRKCSRQSKIFPDNIETFQTIKKLSRQ
jgi:hypothetical protein